jgi:hypothetical protein
LLLVGYECWETLQQTCVEEEGEICTLMLFEMERAGGMRQAAVPAAQKHLTKKQRPANAHLSHTLISS